MISNLYLKLFILLILLVDYQSFPLRKKGKKTIINSNEWTQKWIQKNRNELISMTDQQIRFKLYQELTKYSKIDQKIFNEIFSKVLVHQKKTKFLEKNIYSIRMGK